RARATPPTSASWWLATPPAGERPGTEGEALDRRAPAFRRERPVARPGEILERERLPAQPCAHQRSTRPRRHPSSIPPALACCDESIARERAPPPVRAVDAAASGRRRAARAGPPRPRARPRRPPPRRA